MAGIARHGPCTLGPRTLGPMYSKSLGPRGRGPKVLGVLGPRPLGPWDLRYLGLKVWGPKVRGPKVQGLMALESFVVVCGVRGQARVLLGRLDVIGPGAAAAAGRRNFALQLERRWALQRRADALSALQGRNILRRGHFKLT